jgi:hypothetical protein
MNNKHQAQNGFKTFLLTLVISLGVFGVVYYVTSYPVSMVDIEEHTDIDSEGEALGEATSSPFADLSTSTGDAPRRTVLSGSDALEEDSTSDETLVSEEDQDTTTTTTSAEETAETTPVPDTGIMGLTISLFLSLGVLVAGFYYVYLGPRSLALRSFEDDLLD